jgi:putative heme iron utilization protein
MTAQDGPTPIATARSLLRSVPRAGLGTLLPDDGAPYVSLVNMACGADGAPILLLSDLADHTRNIARDDRVSLLLDGTGERADPLAGERVTLQGRARPTDDAQLQARYLRRHPEARTYAEFRDFRFYAVTVERAHLVAGFGRIHWLGGGDLLLGSDQGERLLEQEDGVIEHMNTDHADAVQLYARMLGRNGGGWVLTGVDPEGCDLRRGPEVARLPFDQPVTDAEGVRAQLVRLVKRARTMD